MLIVRSNERSPSVILKRVAEAALKGRDAREVELTGVEGEALLVRAPVLAADLENVRAIEVRRGVGGGERDDSPTLREIERTTEVEGQARDNDLRERERLVDADIHPQVGRVGHEVGVERDVDAVVADACFVDELFVDDVGFVDRQHLALAVARVAETRNGVELSVRLLTLVLLIRVYPCRSSFRRRLWRTSIVD